MVSDPIGTAETPADRDEIRSESGLSSPHRLFALADGVFAISMTLLALDVRIPDDVPETSAAFSDTARAFYGNFGVFILAFLITGRFWLVNHGIMARLHTVDKRVLGRTIMFLAGICSIPVATSVLFRFGSIPQAVSFAALLLAATSLSSARLWWYLSRPDRNLSNDDPATRLPVLLRALWTSGVFLLAIPVAYLLPHVGGGEHVGYATLVWLLLLFDNPFARLVLRLRRRT